MRLFGGLGAVFALLVISASANAQRSESSNDKFTFWHLSDTRQSAGDNAPLRKLLEEAQNAAQRPAFLVHTGDMTDSGKPEEYARCKEALADLSPAKIGFYAVPGKREMRFSPLGKEGFQNAFGKLYQSFDYGGAHFVLLDSTVALQSLGNIDRPMLKWLEKDLERVRAGTPILVFMNHEFGREDPGVRPIPNEFELWPILRGKNVMAIFTGAGGKIYQFKKNGAMIVTAKQLGLAAYHRVTVTPLLVTIEEVDRDGGGVKQIATLQVSPRARPSVLQAGFDDGNSPYLVRRHPLAFLNPRAVNDNPDTEKAEYRIDDGPWSPMTKDARDMWRQPFKTDQISIGMHSATVRLTTSEGAEHDDEIIFEVERNNKEPLRRWAMDLDGPIQSSPLLSGSLLYVSALDGKCYALELERGRKRWTFTSKGPFLASPVQEGNTLYLGSTDHYLYAIDATNGKQRWKYDTGSPVFATAAVAKGVVCVGSNGKICGVEATTGRERWTREAGGFFQSRAATDGTNFYLTGWDRTLTALDATTGEVKWSKTFGEARGGGMPPRGTPALASPFVVSGRVFLCTTDGKLHALRAESGDVIWSQPTPAGGDPFGNSSPMVVGLNLYVAGSGGIQGQGDVYAYDVATGELIWRSRTGQGIIDSSPRLSPDGKTLAIMGVRGKVSILDVANGKRLWGYELGPGNVFSTPEYDGRAVYTTTMAQDVQAIDGPGYGFAIERRKK
jgi:outer membrane protein assembly factor BamB